MSEREQYVEKIKARIERWDAEIDELAARAREAKADAKIVYEKQLKEMRQQRDEAKSHLHQLSRASDEAWGDIKSGFSQAWDSIKGSYDRAKSRFK